MTQSPETRESLLLRIRDPRDRDAWYEFVSIYRPLIYRVARRYGLQEAQSNWPALSTSLESRSAWQMGARTR